MVTVEAAAERELARVPDWLWDGIDAPVPVEAIADSHFGLLVDEGTDLAALAALAGGDGGPGGTVSGLLLPDRKEIWVDAGEAARAPGRRRFTIAHEVGHWVLHCLRGATGADRPVHCRATEVREEVAADRAEADRAPPAPGPRVRPARGYSRPSSRPTGSPLRCSCRGHWSSASTSASTATARRLPGRSGCPGWRWSGGCGF